jgi:signal transduction histidine kinase
MVLLIIGIIIVILFQRNHEYKAIRSIKKHMLNDIHDEVGSILTKTAMKAEVLNLKMGNQVKDLQDIQQYSREAIQSLRNLLWSISSENMATTDFQDRVNDWLQFIFADTGYEFHFNNLIPENRFTNNVTVRRNIVLIIKELAHNCLKHAHGDQFNITLNMKENKYQLVVTDNGKNENNEILSKGYGLKSIESRVTQIKGKVIFQKTIEGFKTEIIF